MTTPEAAAMQHDPRAPWTRDNPAGFRTRELSARAERLGDEPNAPLRIAMSSEAPVQRWDPWDADLRDTGGVYDEILDHSARGPDLSWVEDGVPFCLNHDIEVQVGKGEKPSVDSDKVLRTVLREGSHPDASWVFADMRDDIRPKVSIGYWPGSDFKQTKDAKTGRITRRYFGWTLYEVSSVTVPADYAVGVGRSANGRAAMPQDQTRTGDTPNSQEHRMSETASVAATPAPEMRAAPAATAHDTRAQELVTIATESGLHERLGGWLLGGVSVEQARRESFEHLRKQQPAPMPAAAPTQVTNVHERAEDKPFASFVDFMRATKRAADGVLDPRLAAQRGVATGMGIGNDADGGFMVPEQFSQGIITRAFEGGRILSRLNPIPVSGNQYHITAVDESSRATGSRWGGVRSYRIGENDSPTASKPKTRRVTLDVTKKLAVLMYASEEQLEDAPATETILNQAATEEITFALEREIIEGIGGAECEGILNSGSLVTVAAEGAQTADTVNATNVVKMNARLWSRSHTNAVWLINQSVLSQLPLMTLANQPVYLPPGGLSQQGFGTLFGKSIEVVEYASAIGDVGDIMLVDLTQYALGDKARAAMARSMHVRFVQGEEAFRLIYRVDGKPLWNSTLTPFKGSDTVSPFVTLAAR